MLKLEEIMEEEILITHPEKPEVYKTYLEKLYEESSKDERIYNDRKDIIKDISQINNDPRAFNRLFCFVYPNMRTISRYLMYSNTFKSDKSIFLYTCLQDKNDVEGEITLALLGILEEIKSNLDILEDKSINHIRNLIGRKTRDRCTYMLYKIVGVDPHQERISKKIRKPIYLDPEKLDISFRQLGQFQFIENRSSMDFISKKIVDYAQNKSRLDKAILYLTMLNPYDMLSNGLTLCIPKEEIAGVAMVNIGTIDQLKYDFHVFIENTILPDIKSLNKKAPDMQELEEILMKHLHRFMPNKSNEEILAFYLTCLYTVTFWGIPFPYRITDQEVAHLIGSTKRIIGDRRKKHIERSFREYWKREIRPFI